jgi:tRNA wybutosine-synthesizing protein 2
MKQRTRDLRKLITDNLDIPEAKQEFLPRGYQKVGKIIILKLRPEIQDLADRIAKLVLKEFPYTKTVCLNNGVDGELREPGITWLAGEKATETIHQENRCKYKLDVTKVMFSKGNLAERGRLPKLVTKGETVVDMFAGIGYFSIPIARHSPCAFVYSIEKNPTSFRYLDENIRLNRVQTKVKPILGDCLTVALGHIADRVLMGYLPKTYHYLPVAFAALKPHGGIIHYHDTFHESELWEKPQDILETRAFKAGYSLKRITHKAVVKEHSPRVYHVVIDAEFKKI